MTFARGDQFLVNFTITDLEDNVIPSENIDEITFTCRTSPHSDSKVLIEKKKSTGDIVFNDGVWEFWFYTTDSNDLDYGVYGFDIEVKAGEVIQTMVSSIEITDEYTYGGDTE